MSELENLKKKLREARKYVGVDELPAIVVLDWLVVVVEAAEKDLIELKQSIPRKHHA